MMQESQTLNAPVGDAFQAKVQPQMNSQGELITPTQQTEQTQEIQLDNFEDVISLRETELAPPSDALYPPTDDTGMEHVILSCGHVLKSTHDLARWSEKTGARRVNGVESLDAVTDLAINLEPNRSSGGKQASSTNISSDPTDDISGLFNEGGKRRGRASQKQWKPVEGEVMKSEVINCWPVLKSTHDQAQPSEKRGPNAVNQADCSGALDELALNQGGNGGQHPRRGRGKQGKQGGQQGQNLGTQAGGSSLQSGLDTQGGSHVQLDGTQ